MCSAIHAIIVIRRVCNVFVFSPYPQTRSLLSVFEEDVGMLTDYTNQLLQSMQRVFGAQVPKQITVRRMLALLSICCLEQSHMFKHIIGDFPPPYVCR